MDILDVAILALRLALVAVLYAFLVVVMRGAARSLRAAGTVAAGRTPNNAGEAQLRVVVVQPGSSVLQSGQVIELADGAVLGRSPRAELVIADPSVSAEHARVLRVGRAWVVSDLGSTNGTALNETRVEGEMPLRPDDVLALGRVRLKVVTR